MPILKTLYNSSPRDVVRKIKRKVAHQSTHYFDLDDVLHSTKHMRSQRMFDFLNRYETILHRMIGRKPLDFANRTVLDFGGGPMLGWGPLAVFRGAKRVVCLEPMFNPEILRSPRVLDKYFLLHYKDLCALYGNLIPSFAEFHRLLIERITVVKDDILQAQIEGSFDIILSNSCLEHVWPLDKTLKRMKALFSSNGRFIHAVDFGNHRETKNPFIHLYSSTPEEYKSRYGNLINCLRPSEMLKAFQDAGFEAQLTPWYSFREFYEDPISDYWLKRFPQEELFLKAAFITEAARS